jgi:hypothetical protein
MHLHTPVLVYFPTQSVEKPRYMGDLDRRSGQPITPVGRSALAV